MFKVNLSYTDFGLLYIRGKSKQANKPRPIDLSTQSSEISQQTKTNNTISYYL